MCKLRNSTMCYGCDVIFHESIYFYIQVGQVGYVKH